MSQYLEDDVPVVQSARSVNSKFGASFGGNTSITGNLTVTGSISGGTIAEGAIVITSSSATAFAVGANGATNPVFLVNANTTSVATGVSITGAAAGSGVAEQVITSGTNENYTIDAAGTGTVGINTKATNSGLVTLGNSTSNAGATVNGNLTVASGSVKIPTGQTFQINSLPIPSNEYVTSGPWSGGASAGASTLVNGTAQRIYIQPNDSTTWKIVNISIIYTVAAGAAATLNIEVAASGTAPGSGTNQMSAALALNSTINTVENGTVTTQTTISGGGSINLIPAGAATTTLAGLVVGITLQRQT